MTITPSSPVTLLNASPQISSNDNIEPDGGNEKQKTTTRSTENGGTPPDLVVQHAGKGGCWLLASSPRR